MADVVPIGKGALRNGFCAAPLACVYCGEPVRPGDPRAPMQEDAHFECGLRSVVGGLNHLMGTCSCCGGDQEPDPPGLSRREAAIVAAALWRHRNSVQARGPR